MSHNPTKLGHIPIGPVRRVLLQWEARQDYQPTTNGHNCGDAENIKPSTPLIGLAFRTGIKEDTLWTIKGREAKRYIEFDLADRLISHINPDLWRTDPELREIYEGFDLSYLDRRRPTTVAA